MGFVKNINTGRKWPLFVLWWCSSVGMFGDPILHVSDRHVAAFPTIVADVGSTADFDLVLIDAHHDSGPGPFFVDGTTQDAWQLVSGGFVTSYNWVMALHAVAPPRRVFWIPEERPLERRAHYWDWLHRNSSPEGPDKRKALDSLFQLASLDTLGTGRERPWALSLDLDIFATWEPARIVTFLNSLMTIVRSNPPFHVDVALSAAYQPSSQRAWFVMETFLKVWSRSFPASRKVIWKFPSPPIAESHEEAAAWARWAGNSEMFRGFAPGPSQFTVAPESVTRLLIPALP